jgi:hypothetical protein
MATSSSTSVGPTDTRIQICMDIPNRLSDKVINEMINMTASRLRFLLGQQRRRQTYHRVTARIHTRAATP